LLVEATAALRGAWQPEAAPQAVLRLSGGAVSDGAALVWVNSAWRGPAGG
jgi:hypothetical protein